MYKIHVLVCDFIVNSFYAPWSILLKLQMVKYTMIPKQGHFLSVLNIILCIFYSYDFILNLFLKRSKLLQLKLHLELIIKHFLHGEI